MGIVAFYSFWETKAWISKLGIIQASKKVEYAILYR